MIEKWEYRLEGLTEIYELNILGAEGWELITMTGNSSGTLCVLKRRLIPEAPASRHEKAVAEGIDRFVESVASPRRIGGGGDE